MHLGFSMFGSTLKKVDGSVDLSLVVMLAGVGKTLGNTSGPSSIFKIRFLSIGDIFLL